MVVQARNIQLVEAAAHLVLALLLALWVVAEAGDMQAALLVLLVALVGVVIIDPVALAHPVALALLGKEIVVARAMQQMLLVQGEALVLAVVRLAIMMPLMAVLAYLALLVERQLSTLVVGVALV